MNSIEQRILQEIGEDTDSPDVFVEGSDEYDQIRDSVNEAVQEICLVSGLHRRKHYIPIESGNNFYKITNDRDSFAWTTSVWLTGQKQRLNQVDLKWLFNYNYRWLYETGTPERYFLIGEKKIGIHPRPSGDNYTLELDCVVIPEFYSLDTDRIKLRRSFEYAAVHYAVSEYWASVGDAKSATEHYQIFLDRMGIMSFYPESYEQYVQAETVKREESN